MTEKNVFSVTNMPSVKNLSTGLKYFHLQSILQIFPFCANIDDDD